MVGASDGDPFAEIDSRPAAFEIDRGNGGGIRGSVDCACSAFSFVKHAGTCPATAAPNSSMLAAEIVVHGPGCGCARPDSSAPSHTV